MIDNLRIFDLASAMVRHAATRQKVIAENIAHADTPGFEAREVQSFADTVRDVFSARATRAGHVGAEPGAQIRAPRMHDLEYPASPNGNTVNLEDQMMRSAQTNSQHNLALAVYAKGMDILRLGLGRAR